jgi:hypothetical protein
MTTRADPPRSAITYGQWLRDRIADPLRECGPDVIDDRPWYRHLPGLNPYAALERQARQAGHRAGKEAEAG